MDSLFIFCFKGCLKGEHDGEYYEILELENTRRCTVEDIKRQYKKLSLNLHPDKLAQRGIENTPEMRQKFLKLKEAYEVLSDPKRKKVYDDMGEMGLKISEGRAADINPLELVRNFQRNRQYRFSLYLCILTIFAALFILPILFSLKADGTLGKNAPWAAIWTPMWIADFLMLLAAFSILFTAEVTSTNEEGETVVVEKISLVERVSNFVLTTMFILVQIFVTMRLDRDVRWSWFAVFAPWFVYEIIAIASLLYSAFCLSPVPPSHENMQLNEEEGSTEEDLFRRKVEAESEYFKDVLTQFQARESIFEHLLRGWLAIFLAVKLDHSVSWDWGLVLLPIWVYLFFKYLMVFVVRGWAGAIQKEHDINPDAMEYETDPIKQAKFMQMESLYSTGTSACFAQCVPLFMALMLISRLDVSSFSTFLIILPVFIFLGCCCLAVCCAVLCIANTDVDEAEEQMKQQQQQQQSGDVESGETYNPPTVFVAPDGGTSASGAAAEYGTFSSERPEESKGSAVNNGGDWQFISSNTNTPMKEDAVSVPVVTNIDPDID